MADLSPKNSNLDSLGLLIKSLSIINNFFRYYPVVHQLLEFRNIYFSVPFYLHRLLKRLSLLNFPV
jgi:hypothetical protein